MCATSGAHYDTATCIARADGYLRTPNRSLPYIWTTELTEASIPSSLRWRSVLGAKLVEWWIFLTAGASLTLRGLMLATSGRTWTDHLDCK